MKSIKKTELELKTELESARLKMFESEIQIKEYGHTKENGVNAYQSIDQVRESETRYRRLFETAQDGILILDAGSGAITDVNPFLIAMLGYTREELIGKRLWEIGAFGDVKESKAAFKELQLKEYIRYKDLPLITLDGNNRHVEFVSNAYLVNGKKVIQCNIRDITDRRALECGLEKTRKELAVIKISADEASEFAESVINTVREPLLSLDDELRVVTVNHSFYEFFKVKPEETVGQLVYDLGNKQWNIPKLRELLETILPEKTTFNDYEVEHDFYSIGKRVMLLNARQIKRGIGKEKIILLAFEDITARKRNEKKNKKLNSELEERVIKRTAMLETANKELEAFSYSVSHDLRAPLRHISGYVDLLTSRFHDSLPEKAQHYLKNISESALHMGSLIDELLLFSRTGRLELQKTEIDMNQILQEALVQVHGGSEEHGIEWVIAPLHAVTGDHGLLRLVWINLVNNAMKFTRKKENRRIEIGSFVENDEAVFFIRDNGVGFDMKYAQKLFGVFQRLHSIEEFEGTGIGLANVRQIIVKHGGRVWATAEIDKGAVFYFTVPLHTKEDP